MQVPVSKVVYLCQLLFALLLAPMSSCKGLEEKGLQASDKVSADSLSKNPVPSVTNHYFVFPQLHAHLKGMVSEFIFKAFEDQQDRIWFCTNHDGVIRYDGNTLVKFTSKDGLGGNAVRSIVQDKSGTLWLGTSNGLTKFDGKFFTTYRVSEYAQDNEIWSVAIDKTGLIWVATNTGARTFDGQKFTKFEVPKAEVQDAQPMLSGARIGNFFIDSKGLIWFITDGYGITKYDGNTFEFLSSPHTLTDNNVTSVFEDKEGTIWIGTFYAGLSKYDEKQYTHYTKEGLLKGNEISNFCEDHAGNIWFSAEGVGVYRYDGRNFTLFTTKDGLTTNTVQHIYADKKGQVWFFTWQGISIYDGTSIQDASEKEPWTK